MYMYDLEETGCGIVDYFYLPTVSDSWKKHILEPSIISEEHTTFKQFIENCFGYALMCDSAWEVEFTECYIGGLPVIPGTTTNAKFLMFKQRNNGSTFVVSEIELLHLGEPLKYHPNNALSVHRHAKLLAEKAIFPGFYDGESCATFNA